ncbi:MAG: hypothetical protein WA906_04990, partial [Pacificimonas sp.]
MTPKDTGLRQSYSNVGSLELPVTACGPQSDVRIVIVQPLFEELNRCRHFLTQLMRALHRRGVGSLMPD